MEFLLFAGILILAGLFPAYLIDAIRATQEQTAHAKRNYACVSFIGLVALLCLFLRG